MRVYISTAVADHVAVVPGAERKGDRRVRYALVDPVMAYRAFLAGVRSAGAAA